MFGVTLNLVSLLNPNELSVQYYCCPTNIEYLTVPYRGQTILTLFWSFLLLGWGILISSSTRYQIIHHVFVCVIGYFY
jgi:hypothetical protein